MLNAWGNRQVREVMFGMQHFTCKTCMLTFFFQTIQYVIQDMTKKEKDQQEAIWELLSTEASYISKLYVIKKVRVCCIPRQDIHCRNVYRTRSVMGMFLQTLKTLHIYLTFTGYLKILLILKIIERIQKFSSLHVCTCSKD